ncbi:uncharacterized protein LOC110916965 isoform X3 [Helianthus annuus]|uniref:uncharacterized protein LOC110916965 isoform X3 n=1 Tax=Helianthus annuus TaxID=4232 RepID=UPI000B900E23|nr:uncharacterized protein LOC110916965 isoform X3 [Helianthus annuus]
MSLFGDDVNYNLEFRSTKDDGWYHCGVVLEHRNRLRVKFKHFDQICNDEVFSVSDFSTNDDVSKFLQRFRPESEPIGDNRCSRVSEGLMVSAACTGGNHLRKFDAVVEAVIKKKHSPEKCLCTCLLFWQHGPEEGHTTRTNLSSVYLIKSGSVDPTVLNFTKLVKEKVNRASIEFTLIPKNPYLFKGTSSNENITKPQDFGSVGHSSHDGFSAGFVILPNIVVRVKYTDGPLGSEGFFPVSDQGCEKETGNQHYLILENLETDLCPLFLIDFIHEQTLITAQAYIIPHLLSETCARAAIVVDKKTELETIYKFLNNPNHIIVSSSGRPWVLAEDKVRTGSFSTNLHGFPPMSEVQEQWDPSFISQHPPL